MTPSRKKNLLIALLLTSFVLVLYAINKLLPVFSKYLEHIDLVVISLIILTSLLVMFFWGLLGVSGGLASFLIAMIFLYRLFVGLNPYYYSVLVVFFFINSFIGYYFCRRIHASNQEHKVAMEKIEEDINLIKDHLTSREKEVSAMDKKVEDLFKIKNIANNLNATLIAKEIIRIISEETFNVFGDETRVLLFTFDEVNKELNLISTLKGKNRNVFTAKKGDIFDKWVLKNMKSLFVKDVKKDFRFATNDEIQDDAVSIIVKPLVIENNFLGILRVDSPHVDAFGQHELRILDIIGDLAAVALENADLYYKTEQLAINDSLTGLCVHRYFLERLDEEIKRALHSKTSFSFLMIDIDNFKDFNDKHGHVVGDVILKNIGNILKSKTSAGDIVARYGGEEFAFVVLGHTREKAIKLAEGIKREIENSAVVLRRQEFSVTVSVGVAVFPEDARLKEDIVWEADKCLYTAKAKGKNRVCTK